MSKSNSNITFFHWLEYALLMAVTGFLRLFPLAVSTAMMGWVWRTIAPHLSRQKRAMDHLRAAFPDKSDRELHAITLSMWENLGRTFAEGLLVDRFREAASDIHLPQSYKDAVEKICERGGGIVVSLHSGNWELGGIVGSKFGFKVASVYQKLKNPLVNEFVTKQRTSEFQGGMFAKGNRAGARLMAFVRDGTAEDPHVAAIMGDLRDRRGLLVPFFGRPAPSNVFPAKMARSLKVPLYVARILRVEGLDFQIEYEEVDVPHSEDEAADILAVTTQIQATFERWIRANPDQWMWAHKRWTR